MQDEQIAKMITENMEKILVPDLEAAGFKFGLVIVENQLEWHFEKCMGENLCSINFYTTFPDHLVIEIVCDKIGKEVRKTIVKYVNDLDSVYTLYDGISGLDFKTEKELKEILMYFKKMILERGIALLEKTAIE